MMSTEDTVDAKADEVQGDLKQGVEKVKDAFKK
jgi:uncharacterized protein YjbJ (UPF0337 family)